MEHFDYCQHDHGDHPCTPIDQELQAKYDNDPVFRKMIEDALASPTVQRPRRQPRAAVTE